MKFLLLVLILVFSAQSFLAQSARKHALLIGVSEYARGGDADEEWWNLNTGNDVAALKETLQNKFGFKPGEIRILRTKRETTKSAILSALNNLVATVKAGDIVYLHYSGHGAQILDDNADEIDGLDESLVPSDYASRDDSTKNIRDDEIGKILNALRLKNPASVTFTFDSCFSGTITRDGRFLSRGEKYRGAKPKIPAKVKAAKDDSTGLLDKNISAKNFVVISAARSDETAKETGDDAGNKIGALTFSLIKAFGEADSKTTYRDVFERTRYFVSTKNPLQNPQIEGAIDSIILSGAVNPPQPYVGVRLGEKGELILQAGSLHGMTTGSRFAVYPNGTKQSTGAASLAEATIEETGAATSKLKIDGEIFKKYNAEIWQTARAFEIEHVYTDANLKVAVSGIGKTATETELINDLKDFPLAVLTTKDDWDVKISGQADNDFIRIERADGSTLAEIKRDENASRNTRIALEREARFRVVQSLENNSPDLNVELRVVPVTVEKDARGAVSKIVADKKIDRNKAGKFQFSAGEYVALEVRNKGYLDAYITILDLTSDGTIGAMYPHPQVAMPDNKIPADGEWRRLPLPFVFRITPPAGTEIYKLIATREPTDFSPLLDARIVRDQSNEKVKKALTNPLGKILRSATLLQRSNAGSAAPPDWSVATVAFEVVSGN